MLITCPDCQFTQNIPEDKIPPTAQVATCPRCKTKFRFRDLDEVQPQEAPEEQTAAHKAEPEVQEVAAQSPSMGEPAVEPASEPVAVAVAQDVVDRKIEDNATSPEDHREEVAAEPRKPVSGPEEIWQDAPDQGREGLWDKLDSMAPKQEQEKPEPSEPKREYQSDMPPLMDDEDPVFEEPRTKVPHTPVPSIEPPFERLDQYGFFPGFIQTVMRVLLSPKLFFQAMPLGKGLVRPLSYAMLIVLVQGILGAVYAHLGFVTAPIAAANPPAEAIPLAQLLIRALVSSLIFGFLSMFVVSGIYHGALMLFKAAKGGYEATFRAVAYSWTPMVIAFLPAFNQSMYIAMYMIVSIWSLVLMVVGWRHLHQTTIVRAGLAAILVMSIMILFLVAALQGKVPTV